MFLLMNLLSSTVYFTQYFLKYKCSVAYVHSMKRKVWFALEFQKRLSDLDGHRGILPRHVAENSLGENFICNRCLGKTLLCPSKSDILFWNSKAHHTFLFIECTEATLHLYFKKYCVKYTVDDSRFIDRNIPEYWVNNVMCHVPALFSMIRHHLVISS